VFPIHIPFNLLSGLRNLSDFSFFYVTNPISL
jgi:hypothetical protein